MPTYNSESYLNSAVDSILSQTYENWELIVIDDESKDNTMKILKEYASKDSRIKIIIGQKKGIAAALNLGIDNSMGEYIARMDSDDISLPDRIKKQVEYMELHQNIDVCSTGYDIILNGETQKLSEKVYDDNEISARFIFECVICHPTVMLRKSVVDNWHYDENVFSEDYDLWTRMIPYIHFSIIDEKLFCWRIFDKSISNRNKDRVFKSSIMSSKNLICRLFELNKNDYIDEVFCNNCFFDLIQTNFCFFMLKQFNLLVDIIRANDLLEVFNKDILCKVCADRWKRIFEFIDIKSSILKNKDFLNVENISIIFTDKLALSDYYKKIKTLDVFCKELLLSDRKIVIYGAGNMCADLFAKYKKAKKIGKLNWELVGVVDKNVRDLVIDGGAMQVHSPDFLHQHDIDYIIISSRVYYNEIKDEIKSMGICEEKILKGDFIWLCQ